MIVKYIFFFVFVFLILSCVTENEITVPMIFDPNNEYNYFPVPGERYYGYDYYGVVQSALINSASVSVHRLPFLESEVISYAHAGLEIYIKGISNDGDWLLISPIIPRGLQDIVWFEGWVLSEHVFEERLERIELNIFGFTPDTIGWRFGLNGTYVLGDSIYPFSVRPSKLPEQDFYTFVWDYNNEKFHYRTIPGTYIWYPDTNELIHLTYLGSSQESSWTIVTDDFKYMLSEAGTAPGLRALGIWRVEDGEQVFSGQYLHPFILDAYTVEIAYAYFDYRIPYLDEEIIAFAEEFYILNPRQDDRILIIFCEYNFDTGYRRIIRGEYIYLQ